MKRKIGKYIINTDLITHIYREEEKLMYTTNSNQSTWIASNDIKEPDTIYICFGECFLRFIDKFPGYTEALELYSEFDNEA